MIEIDYIACPGRSGSTLVGSVLGLAPRRVFVGELRGVWKEGLAENQPCGCGRNFRDCDFWRKVFAQPSAASMRQAQLRSRPCCVSSTTVRAASVVSGMSGCFEGVRDRSPIDSRRLRVFTPPSSRCPVPPWSSTVQVAALRRPACGDSGTRTQTHQSYPRSARADFVALEAGPASRRQRKDQRRIRPADADRPDRGQVGTAQRARGPCDAPRRRHPADLRRLRPRPELVPRGGPGKFGGGDGRTPLAQGIGPEVVQHQLGGNSVREPRYPPSSGGAANCRSFPG